MTEINVFVFVQRVTSSSQTWSPVIVPAIFQHRVRQFQTSCQRPDIDQAAKYIGAGAATVGVAGSGNVKNCSALFC